MKTARFAILSILPLVLSLALSPPSGTGAPSPSLDPLRPTFSGSVVACRTTTVGPGGILGGTRVGGALDAEVADVTGDGIPDLVTTGRAGDSVAGTPAVFVHPGRGDGSFGPPMVTICSASASSRLVVDDLDGDGRPDAILGGPGSPATYAVLRGVGNGGFIETGTFQVNSPSLTSGAGFLVAHLDADDVPDVAVAATGGQVALLFGTGQATFTGPTLVAAGTSSADLAAADLDGDGDDDLVVADSATASLVILISAGDGTFAPLAPMPIGTIPNRVVATDAVGDARPDLVATGPGVEVLRNDGALSFVSAYSGATGGLGHPAVLDMDGDGDRDLVLGIPGAIHLGDGAGGFTAAPAGSYLADLGSFGSPVAPPVDLDGDGRLDLVMLSGGGAVSADRWITPLMGRGPGLQNPRVTSLGGIASGTPVGVVAADLDGDGFDDLATAFTSTVDGSSYVAVTYSDTQGRGPTAPFLFPIGLPGAANVLPAAIASGDFDGDGTADLVVASGLASTLPLQLAVVFGNRQRTIGAPLHLASGIPTGAGFAGLSAVTVADFDGDGTPDIAGFQTGGGTPPALAPSLAAIYLSNGAGGFGLAGTVAAARTNSSRVPAADVNGDGRADLVLRISPSALSVVPATGAGLFGAAAGVIVPIGAGEAAGDLDGDGLADLVVFTPAGAGFDLVWLRSLGLLAFAGAVPSGAATPDVGPGAVAMADLNGDGLLDIATDGAPGADLGVFVQRSDGLFDHLSVATLSDGSGIAAGDLDGDGLVDLVNVGAVGASPLFHEWFRNTTVDRPGLRDAERRKARRGEILRLDARISNAAPSFRADLGPGVTVFRQEPLGGNDWRLHLHVDVAATPGERDLTVVRPDGDEGATGLDGARSEALRDVLRVLEDGVEPVIDKLKYPGRSKGYLSAGHAAFTLDLRGDGYGDGAEVFLAGAALTTDDPRSGGRKISAEVPAESVADPGALEVILVNVVGPPSNTILLSVIGPEIVSGSAKRKSDGRMKLTIKGRNFQKSGFEATVRRLDSGTTVPVAKISRASKKKVRLKIEPTTPVPAGTDLEVTVSYLGALGNRIESAPLVIEAP